MMKRLVRTGLCAGMLLGLSVGFGCSQNQKCCGAGGSCCKAGAKTCPKDCKMPCCAKSGDKSAAQCGPDCTKPCCVKA